MWVMREYEDTERVMYAEMARYNRVAKRLPARKRKHLYGKAKQPFTFGIHDEIRVHGVARTKHIPIPL